MTLGQTASRWRLHAGLLALWFAASFGVTFFARDLQASFLGWPVGYWFASQGAVLVFIGIVVAFAYFANRREAEDANFDIKSFARRTRSIHWKFATYVIVLLLVLVAMVCAERAGLGRNWLAGIFLSATLVFYAVIGVMGRTADASEYYVAGRRIPAMYNGMAAAADWMSAASFISLAGGLYLQGFTGAGKQPGGLAYVLGWTGGFCLVALLVAPYLRRLNIYTLPDYFAHRYGGNWPRLIAAWAAVLCSFTYVVAQLYGVGLITARLTGVHFEIGILLGLGGVLVCSFLGGMRAVTWTQVTQYVVLILAFLIPVSWLSYKQTGNPLAPLAYGQQLDKIADLERQILASPQEQDVLHAYAERAKNLESKLQDVESALQNERQALRALIRAQGEKADSEVANRLRRELAALPKDTATAKERWTREMWDFRARSQALAGLPVHARPFAGNPDGTEQEQEEFQTSRLNFLALMFCLMVGTAGPCPTC